MHYYINVPEKIDNDVVSFNWLAQVAASSLVNVGDSIDFDFEKCHYFVGNLCAAFGAILQGLVDRRNKIQLINLQPYMKGFMSKNRLLTHFANLHVPDFDNSTIPFSRFRVEDENRVKLYVEKQLLEKPDMPRISEQLKKEIVKSIFELYANALTHGNCEFVFSCGQLYSRKNPPEIYFTFVDLGKTIKNNVAEFLNQPTTGIESISWATSDYNSTKTQNHSGGLGLKLIRDFIILNNGVMQIISADGVWELNRGKNVTDSLYFDFPGTIVNLIFNLKDNKQYYLASEITLDNLF